RVSRADAPRRGLHERTVRGHGQDGASRCEVPRRSQQRAVHAAGRRLAEAVRQRVDRIPPAGALHTGVRGAGGVADGAERNHLAAEEVELIGKRLLVRIMHPASAWQALKETAAFPLAALPRAVLPPVALPLAACTIAREGHGVEGSSASSALASAFC